jgi:hypothetical protein
LGNFKPSHSFHLFSRILFFSFNLGDISIFFLIFLFFLTILIILLGFEMEVFECFFLIFLKYLFKIIIIFSSEYILIFFDKVLRLDLIILCFFLYFSLLDSGFDLLSFIDELFFVLFFSNFLLFLFKSYLLWCELWIYLAHLFRVHYINIVLDLL